MLDPTQMIDALIAREGGYVNDPDDAGVATNMGITIRTLQQWRANLSLTAEDVQNLTRDEAETIYRRLYWQGHKVALLSDGLQPLILDACVLEGPKKAWWMLQRSINVVGICAVEEDGIPGPKTIDAAEGTAAEQENSLIAEMVRQRCIHFDQLAIAKPSQRKFLDGWKNRANSFKPTT